MENRYVRKVSTAGIITTVAGNGNDTNHGTDGDGGLAVAIREQANRPVQLLGK